jgi:hypothetical protein
MSYWALKEEFDKYVRLIDKYADQDGVDALAYWALRNRDEIHRVLCAQAERERYLNEMSL